MDEYAERLTALAAHWNTVEGRIKQYENFSGDANASAINELRYAGRKLVDALDLMVRKEDAGTAITIAENYMVNADHDVTDGVCFIVLKHLNRVIKKHSLETIGEHYPDFWDIYPLVRQAQKIVEGSREDRINRKADYAKLANEFLPKLRELHERLLAIKALHVPDEADELRAIKARVAIITGVTFVGAIFSILAFFLTWWAWAYPLSYWEIFWRIF
jgi:hypothetical protein